MPLFCIPKQYIETLQNAALKGKVNLEEIFSMTSKERREYFSKFTTPELGKFVNTELEKAMVSRQKDAILQWAESVFSPKQKKESTFKSLVDKINELDNLGVLNPKNSEAFLEDLAAHKLGMVVTPEEVKIISEKASKLEKAYEKIGDNLGNVVNDLEGNLEYFKQKKEMDNYLSSLNPSSKLKVFSSVIGRASMLFSLKSPILNIESNTVGGILEALSRRMGGGEYIGKNGGIARQYIKNVNKIFKETGYDVSRMLTINEAISGGGKALGEEKTHTQGPGAVRKVGQIYEDFVFGKLMSAPDVAFSSFHFADSSNLMSTKIAKSMGLKDEALTGKAAEIMKDAMSLTPKTAEGEIVRSQAITDAAYATWTNKSRVSQIALKARDVLNTATGNFRVGDWLIPFVKTPANIIEAGFDYAGLGGLKAVYKTGMAIKNGELKNAGVIRDIYRDATRAGLGLTAAFLTTKFIGNDDFMGVYDPARKDVNELAGKNYNAVKIGNKWISLDYFGPIAVPLTGMLYARKYGDNTTDKLWKYLMGTGASLSNLPGIEESLNIYSAISNNNPGSKKATIEEDLKNTPVWIADQLSSRIIPGFMYDLAKVMDKFQRKPISWQEKIMTKIPGLSQFVPEKKDVFGDSFKNEPWYSVISTGARFKTAREGSVIKELDRLSNEGFSVSITDLRKTNGTRIAELKNQIGEEKFKEAVTKYGENLKGQMSKIISGQKYSGFNDEEKKKQLDYTADQEVEKILQTYKYKASKRERRFNYIK